MAYRVHLVGAEFELALVVIGTDCIGSCKSNYHTIMAMEAQAHVIIEILLKVALNTITLSLTP
jgi:hypothetical protein